MRTFGGSERVAGRWAADRPHELAVALVLVVPGDGAAAVGLPGASPKLRHDGGRNPSIRFVTRRARARVMSAAFAHFLTFNLRSA